MKIKTLFIISGILTLLMFIPAWLAVAVSSVQNFFIVDAFGESILQNNGALEVFDTFLLVLGCLGAGIVIAIFGATTITDLDALKKLALLFGLLLFFVALPDYVALMCGGAHPPVPIMLLNIIAYLLMFYGWKRGVA